MEYFVLYLCIVNALGFVLMLVDKKKAIKRQWRIPEHTLLTVAMIGGSLGSLLGMSAFHHKTRRTKFALGIPAILLVQTILIAFLFMK